MRKRTLELIAGVARQVKQGIDFGNGNVFGAIGNLGDFVAGADVPFLQHTKVKAGPVMRHQHSRHSRLVHPDAHAIARHARLRYFE